MPEAYEESRSVRSYYFAGGISAVCVLRTLRRLRMAFTEDRFGQARGLAPRERVHGRGFKGPFALIDVNDNQAVGGQRARVHGLRDGGLELHIVGFSAADWANSLVTAMPLTAVPDKTARTKT
jgi:hypothetical protein